ncbi:MAG TPA: inorganic phosphate transporter [Thermoplasmata archaeon]|nr:inorganic phosphate transporter [Thermoplasmata archaeon]
MVALSVADGVLIVAALAFAWSIGAHYTGACMGMAFSAGAVTRREALGWMAVLTAVGAAVASGKVVGNIGLNLVDAPELSAVSAAAVVGTAFALTTVYNYAKVPTSTIQIFVFCLIGVSLGAGIPVHWGNVVGLVEIWATAPLAAVALGYLFTRLLSLRSGVERPATGSRWSSPAAALLVVMALAASFAMGANDVANATAVFVSTGLTSILLAGVIGGLALAVGVVSWGGRLLSTVSFDIVRLDRRMAVAAQAAQATVILVAVVLVGAFTSMNQALIGGMAGAGLARGERTIHWPTLRGILVGWAVGPASGILAGLACTVALVRLGVPL